MFDKVLLLSRGEAAFYGKASDMVSYFAAIGYQCPTYSNPADFALDLINVDTKNAKTMKKTTDRLQVLVNAYNTASSSGSDQETAETESKGAVKSMKVCYYNRCI
jgi:ATP-binding cassette subfamily G (WHITE) protein 1